MQPRTHLALDERLCGSVRELSEGRAVLELATTPDMAADAHGLVHGGFVFGLADAAAMFAINEPNVVLGSAEVRFLAPVRLGDALRAVAQRAQIEGKKHHVEVEVRREGDVVFAGNFVCFVPSRHVLEARAEGERR